MTRSISILLSIAMLSSHLTYGQKEEKYPGWQISKSPGITFFKPEQLFSREVQFSELPELGYINVNGPDDVGAHIRQITNFLHSNGIPLGLGVNSNRDSAFDLYAPYVDILLDEPAAQFGRTRESEVGKLHFITHDSTHLYFGVPGPRLKDLENLPQAKERLKKILMDIEASASAWTSANHVRWYWRYRQMTQKPDTDMEKFDQYNKGLRTVGTFDDKDYTDLLRAYMSGEYREMVKLYSRNLNYDIYKEAQAAQVPMLFPSFEQKVGTAGEKLLMKYGFPVLFPLVHMYDKKFGYVNLIQYAGLQADFYLSDWYVKWADTFQIGEDLDTLEKNLNKKIQDLREGKHFTMVTQPKEGVFELMYVRNAITQFGRKLIEFQHLDKDLKAKSQAYMTDADRADLEQMLEEAKRLNNEALAIKAQDRAVTTEEFQRIRSQATNLFNKAQIRFPINKILPVQYRPAHADYSNFWQDPFSIVLARPEGLTKFLSAKGIWAEALRQRLAKAEAEATGKPVVEVDLEAKPNIVGELEKQIARKYNDYGRKGRTVLEVTGPIEEKSAYLQHLELLRRSVNTQVLKVFLPQVMLIPNLPAELKKRLYDVSEEFAEVIDKRLIQFRADYESRFRNYDRDEEIKNRLIIGESSVKWAIEISMNEMVEIINELESAKKLKKVEKSIQKRLDKIARYTSDVKEGKEIHPTLADTIKKVTPVKTGLFRTLCSAITRMCFNQKLSKIIRDVPTRPFLRYADQQAEWVFIDRNGKAQDKKFELPENAAIIIAMNHDNASLDGMFLQEVAKILGVSRNVLLTTEDAWPHIQMLKKIGISQKDKNILFKQDKEVKRKVIEAFKAQKQGRVAFSIFPEGELPFWHTQFPIFTHFGAFSIARSASHELKDIKPVYYVEVQSNFLRVTTSKERVQTRIEIYEPELVPTDPVGTRDAWVESRRERFEERANSPERRAKMVDMIERKKISEDGRIYVADDVREFRTTGEFFHEETSKNTKNQPIMSCKAAIGGL